MLIDKSTKISQLIRHNPDAMEAIIKINPLFDKLRNPILRKLMAGRTSIAMAAKVGGMQAEDFYRALKPLGFEHTSINEEPMKAQPTTNPAFEINPEKVIEMDVRPILEGGEDPLHQIQAKVKSIKTGEILKIINTFEPSPLIALLEKQGFMTYVNKVAAKHIETFFYKKNNAKPVEEDEVDELQLTGWQETLDRFEGKIKIIDVRNLEMPLPMTTILESIESLGKDQALFVNHKRVPVYLLPELSDRNMEYRIKDLGDNEVQLLIFKKQND